MFEDTSEPKKRLTSRYDLLIILVSAIAIYAFASSHDLFEVVLHFLGQVEHLELDELFIAFLGTNIIFSGLLIYRRRRMSREFECSRNAARDLAQERILLRTVIDQLPDYIFVKNRSGQFIMSNVAHARAVKSTPESLIGKRASDVFPPELATQFTADDQRIMFSVRPLINAERRTVDESGAIRFVLTTKIPLSDSTGQVIGLVGISRDITDHKLKEQHALELAQERERVKMMTLFTRDAAHDFRTPLATINTSAYLLLRSPDPERQTQHVKKIEQAVTRLSKLLDGLTLMTQLESSSALDTSTIDINHLIRTASAAAPSLMQHPGLQVTLDLDKTLPLIPGSADELYVAFLNLIDNAVQFTPDGGTITVQTRQHEDEVEILVRDTGTGISADDLPHIFERFFRTDRARSSETGGIGLGLSITRKIIELHRGRIEAESVEGEGSTFRVYLPLTYNDFNDVTRPSRN